MNNIATLQEIETHWSIIDLADANEALDVKEALDAEYHERLRHKKK